MALIYPAPCSSFIDKIDVFVSHALGSNVNGDVNGTYIQVYISLTFKHQTPDTPVYCLFPCLDKPVDCSPILRQPVGDKLDYLLIAESHQGYYDAPHTSIEPRILPIAIVENDPECGIMCDAATTVSNFVTLHGQTMKRNVHHLSDHTRYFACITVPPDMFVGLNRTCIISTSWFTPITRDAAYKQLIAGLPQHDSNCCETIYCHDTGRRFVAPMAPLLQYLFELTPGGGPASGCGYIDGSMRQALVHAKKGALFVPTLSNRLDRFKTDVYVADADYDSIGDVPCTEVKTDTMKSEYRVSNELTRLKFNVSCIRHVHFREVIKEAPLHNVYVSNNRSLYFTGALNALECPNRTTVCTNGAVCIDATALHTVDVHFVELCVLPTVCGCHLFMTQPYNMILDEPRKMDIIRHPFKIGPNTLVMFFDAMIRAKASSDEDGCVANRQSYPVVCMAMAKDHDTETRFYIVDVSSRSLFGDVWAAFVYDMSTPVDFIAMNCTRQLFHVS